ncbi:aldolase/citrate lyase family protein [Thomasclavelia spiroformis]|uniref:aldolase/citrate lyase family protein n=1 Tax=Thomasclavelia spiroformis TaxID=29348 RepID=UPI00241CA700|nr:aldolase/citrate lyase family protein [Thomasclavelia spiroformis]MBS6685940.1 aldolase [Thomasclavelia spiroformis]
MLKLMYITNRADIAQIAESAGVDRIFVDLEFIGKSDRQGGMDTVQSKHTLDDIKTVANAINNAELLVRVNPIHDEQYDYPSSKVEIDTAIENGAKILMLPYFKTIEEVKTFIDFVDGRVKTMLLLETPEAVEIIDEILNLNGLDEIFIGLNDLSLGYKKKFMFELLADGTVEDLCYKFKKKGIPYGFGGIASLGKGALPSEFIITEHYRLGSTCAILSRSFCNVNKITHMGVISSTFVNGVREIRNYENEVNIHKKFFENNIKKMKNSIQMICEGK